MGILNTKRIDQGSKDTQIATNVRRVREILEKTDHDFFPLLRLALKANPPQPVGPRSGKDGKNVVKAKKAKTRQPNEIFGPRSGREAANGNDGTDFLLTLHNREIISPKYTWTHGHMETKSKDVGPLSGGFWTNRKRSKQKHGADARESSTASKDATWPLALFGIEQDNKEEDFKNQHERGLVELTKTYIPLLKKQIDLIENDKFILNRRSADYKNLPPFKIGKKVTEKEVLKRRS